MCFSPAGGLLMTASADKTARIWFTDNGICSQILSGHDSEVFSCGFSYSGDVVVTASKDNTCKLWRWYDWYTVKYNTEDECDEVDVYCNEGVSSIL